jgi:putative hemolysin
LVLLAISALISGSESAIFSITNKDVLEIPEGKGKDNLTNVLSTPKKILATILLTNNTVNVAFVVITARIIQTSLNSDGSLNENILHVIQIAIETMLLLVFGEVIPKIYATANKVEFGLKVSPILLFLKKIFNPLVSGMVKMSNFFDHRFHKQNKNVSIDELTQAIEITSEEHAPQEEKEILKSIIKFGSLSASQIMTSRTEMETIGADSDSNEVMEFVHAKGFSRVPIHGENMDDIKGILYVKDLLKFADDEEPFEWKRLIRPAMFIPEKKRIDDLLTDFQEKRVHMAIVVDEFGGTEGLVTMEDILEQVFGEIMDEFDEVNINYSKLDDSKYIFDAQTLLTDVVAITKLEDDIFEEYADDADTLAGLLMEICGSIPKKGEELTHKNLTFTVESASNRKLNRIKLVINEIIEDENLD